jgi:hypothetical protein
MEWLIYYTNIVDIIINFSMHLRSPKSKFGWKNYSQNINRSATNSTPYGPYAFPYDPYTLDSEIQTELAATV